MKVWGNIGFFCFLAKSLVTLGDYKTNIEKMRAEGKDEEEREAIYTACQYWSKKIVKYLDLDIEIVNPENLPEKGPVLYVANHQSYADILAFLNITKHQIGFIAKNELTKIPLFRDWIVRIRSLFIMREDPRASLNTINEGAEMLKNGFSLVIFPEGTRSKSGKMADFKPGSLKLATKAKATIVPVTIIDSYKAFEEKGKIAKHTKMAFKIHEPIDTSLLDRKEQAALGEKIEQIIRAGLE